MQCTIDCNCRCSQKVSKIKFARSMCHVHGLYFVVPAHGVPSSWSTEARIALSVIVTVLQTLNPKPCLDSRQGKGSYLFSKPPKPSQPHISVDNDGPFFEGKAAGEWNWPFPHISEIKLSFHALPPSWPLQGKLSPLKLPHQRVVVCDILRAYKQPSHI